MSRLDESSWMIRLTFFTTDNEFNRPQRGRCLFKKHTHTSTRYTHKKGKRRSRSETRKGIQDITNNTRKNNNHKEDRWNACTQDREAEKDCNNSRKRLEIRMTRSFLLYRMLNIE